MPISPEREQEIKAALKRCSDDAVSAAFRFQESRSMEDLSRIIHAVLERDLPDVDPEVLAGATDDTLLVEGLGMDSFGMMELVMTAEEVFGINIPNEELRGITTLGALRSYVLAKVKSASDEATVQPS